MEGGKEFCSPYWGRRD
uniref:Uncharacterized protein n=1 Tax=Anguilla anguilla TaxID=7936 RepID=A0A0E9THH2_ANGAN